MKKAKQIENVELRVGIEIRTPCLIVVDSLAQNRTGEEVITRNIIRLALTGSQRLRIEPQPEEDAKLDDR